MASRSDIINYFLSEMEEPTRYLEIGTGCGSNGALVKATEKWGVDPVLKKVGGHDPEKIYTRFFLQTSNDFFKSSLGLSEKFDVVFIDGLHLKEQVYLDVFRSLSCLSERGVIVMHDCNPATEAMQAVPRQQSSWNGDCWKAMVKLRSEHPELFCRVIMQDQGVGVVIRRPPGKKVRDVNLKGRKAFDLQYSDLEANRVRLLGHVAYCDMKKLRKQAAE